MARRALLPLAAASLCLAGPATASASPWKLAFADSFNGGQLDRRHWSAYHGAGNQGHGVRRPSQVAVRGGRLVLTARMIGGVLHSGGVAHRRNRAYGRYEFRVRTEPDPGAATSAVVLTWPESNNSLRDGENDIYETGAYADRNPFYSFVHFGTQQYNVVHRANGTRWHKMVMTWGPRAIRIYRDGRRIRKITDVAAIPDSRHHLAIQLDAVKGTMTGVVRMYVDDVRIYRRA